jgi:leucine dehydrogenase
MSEMVGSLAAPSQHESIHYIDDVDTGLTGVIIIHSTSLGPAAGGCRLWPYASHADLVTDARRLAEGMSFKNALAGLPFGGGKAVLMAPLQSSRTDVFQAFGRAVANLDGRYVTAEDVGTGVADMEQVRCQTRFVAGLTQRFGYAGGDPSPWTALGTFEAMKLAAARRHDTDLVGLTVAVQGLGNVGRSLCQLLAVAGARLVVADVDRARVDHVTQLFNATPCAPELIHRVPADIFAPCAMGGALSEASISELRATIVCGAANNQLATVEDGHRLHKRGVLYCPDYVVNAGGMINVAAEHLGESTDEVEARVRRIPGRLAAVLDRSDDEDLPTQVVANRMAEALIAAAACRRAA